MYFWRFCWFALFALYRIWIQDSELDVKRYVDSEDFGYVFSRDEGNLIVVGSSGKLWKSVFYYYYYYNFNLKTVTLQHT